MVSWHEKSAKRIADFATFAAHRLNWDVGAAKDFFFTRLAVALQKGNGRSILAHRSLPWILPRND